MKFNKQKNIPEGWQKITLSEIGQFFKGAGITKDQLVADGANAIRYGELYTRFDCKIKHIYTHVPDVATQGTEEMLYGDILFAGSGETIDEIGKSAAYLLSEPCFAGGDIIIFRPEKQDSLFLAYFLNVGLARKRLRELGQGQSVVHLYKRDLEKLTLPLPPLPEQHRIVAVLETWDAAIEKLARKIEIKKNIKKGLMQKLLTGGVRLPGFSGEWRMIELGKILNYEQPIQYLVSSIDYSFDFKIPVLTAGKSFILGYTNDTDGIYRDLPVIILDDFTTSSKFVDFPFKVKSSAIKFLKPNEYNLRFVFERMQLLNMKVEEHKRRYLSEYQFIAIKIPNKLEQVEVATVFESNDKELTLLENQLILLKKQKKFLLNNLVTGKIRVPELK